jgi:tetratricopeptide (TPR) repeat protein
MSDYTDGSQGYAKLHLLGVFSLTAADGRDCTPKNKKAQAILAMLALSPRGSRTRAWLRNKLWSDSDEHHSSSSLRQTLFELKRALGDAAVDFLEFDRQVVSIRFERLWIDVRVLTDNPGLIPTDTVPDDLNYELLEGLDINDEEFEDWLCMERSVWEKKLETLANHTPAPLHQDNAAGSAPAISHGQIKIEIGLLPSIVHGQNAGIQPLGDFITESIATSLAEFQNLKILDFRLDFGVVDSIEQRSQADFLIRTRVLSVADSVTLTFLVYSADTLSLLMSQSTQFRLSEVEHDDMTTINHFIGQNIDQLAKTVERYSKRAPTFRNDRQTLVGYGILSGMFDLEGQKFRDAVSLLERLSGNEENTLFKGLLAYSSSFALGENLGNVDQARLETIEKLACDTLQANPFNSITLACLGHVYGYVFNRHELAAELFNRAVHLNPMQAFVWDHLALHRLYTGDLEGAQKASERAVYLGTYSPINYTYETTSCMISSLSGDHRRAVHLGYRALSKQPNFNAAIRYSLASCGHLEAHAQAHDLLSRLLQNDPDFLAPEVQRSRFRLPLPEACDLVLTGIKKAIC